MSDARSPITDAEFSLSDAEFQRLLREKIQSFSNASIVAADDKLFSTGLIDSMTIVDVIMLVEEYWNVQVDPTDLSMDNFDSVAAISRYVHHKRSGGH